MVLVQKWKFFQLSFYAILARKMSFTIFLTHGFDAKMAIFPPFLFQAIQATKMSFTIFQNKKTAFQAIKTRHPHSRKIAIFLKGLTYGFRPKMAIFQSLFFQALYAKKMSFTLFQNEKTPFQPIKTTSSNNRKIDIFLKGLTHGFAPKIAIFSTFFQAIYAGKMSFTIFQNEKTAFQAKKRRRSKRRQIDIFAKGLIHGFGPKIAIFSTFFFRQYRSRKCLLQYSSKKKRLSRL